MPSSGRLPTSLPLFSPLSLIVSFTLLIVQCLLVHGDGTICDPRLSVTVAFTGGHLVHRTAMATTPEAPRKRRVPDSLRRRTLVSCDRCKTRRVRCCRANENEPCKNCVSSGLPCESKLPRKQRVYGSVEKLSLRYRALDALVKGLFPEEDSDDIDTLYRLASQRSISMPSIDDQTPAPDAFNGTSISVKASSSPTPTTPSQFPIEPTAAPGNSLSETVDSFDMSTEIPEEHLIPAPHDVLHYLGRGSSFEFAAGIRSLVAKYNRLADLSGQPNVKRRQRRLDFANMVIQNGFDDRSKAHQPPPGSQEAEQELWEPPSITRMDYKQLHATPDSWDMSSGPPTARFLDLLPPKEVADSLLRTFFDRVHPNFVVFHRPSFQQEYDSLWSASTALADEPDAGWVCSLFMAFAFGAQALENDGIPDATSIQRRYLRMVRARFQRLAFTASLSNVQALLLLQLYEHNSGERNTGWVLLGFAARMAIALGLHREGPNKSFDPVERNTRRVVWWTLFTYEQSVSFVMGRPTCIEPVEVNAKAPDEAAFESGEYPPDYTGHFLALTSVLNRIKRFMTMLSTKWMKQEELLPSLDTARHLLADLSNWEANLPRHLASEWQFASPRHRRAVTLMHIYFCHIKVMVTRSYLLCKVSTNIDRLLQPHNPSVRPVDSNIEALAHECRVSANTLINHLLRLSHFGLLEGIAWVDFYYAWHASLALSLDFLARPRGSMINTAMDRDHRATVSLIIQTSKRYRLASTYQILSHIAIQVAEIVEIGCDDEQLQPPPHPQQTLPIRPLSVEQGRDDPVQTIPYAQQFFLGSDMTADASQEPTIPDPVPELISNLYYYRCDQSPWSYLGAPNAATDATQNGFIPDTTSQQISAGYPAAAFDSAGNLLYGDPHRGWTPR